MASGKYDVQYYKEGYAEIWYYEVQIDSGVTTVLDVALGNPTMEVLPTSINEMVPLTQTTTVPMTVTNNGNAPLNWSSDIVYGDDIVIKIAPFTGTVPVNTYEASAGLDPGNDVGYSPPHGDPELVLPRGTTVWCRACEYSSNPFYCTFDTDTPGDMTEILVPPAWNSFAGDYSTESDEYFYIAESDDYNVYTVDAATGVATLVGSTGLSENLSGMACDKVDGTMYACTSSSLYTIDLTTGAATLVGTVGTSGSLLALACDGEQNLWAVDLDLDVLWSIDKDTGAGTQVGSLGFDCTYAQSMSWDPSTDVLYWAAYGGGLDGHLRVIDRTTGNSTTVGDFEGGREVTVFAIPGGGTSPYITLDPPSGTVDPGTSMPVSCILDACGEPLGTIINADIFFVSPQIIDPVDVPVTFMVGDPQYGDLSGTVTDSSTQEPIEGAMITVYDGVSDPYIEYSGSDGSYLIEDIYVGTYAVDCTADGYNPQTVNGITIEVGQATVQNFALTAPNMVVNPLVINTSVDPTTPIQIDITIDNTGDGPLEWFASLDNPSVSLAPAPGNHPVGTDAVSSGSVPQGLQPSCGANEPNFTLTRGSIGWGIEGVDDAACWLDTDDPDVLNDVFVPSFATYAGEYGPDNDTHMYFFDNDTKDIIYVNMSDGSSTTIGNTGIVGTDEFMNDMAFDRTTGTMYGAYNNNLYTIDLATGAITLIGPFGNTGGLMIAIAVDGNGNMWGHDLGADEIWSIDKATGAGTSIGSTGFDANYAQSMAWDPTSNIVYLAAFNNTNLYYELRSVDLTTGNTALLGGVYYKEIVVFSFPGDVITPWITIDPYTDIVPAEGTSTLHVNINTVDYEIGEILNAVIRIESDPDIGTVDIPVTILVDNVGTGQDPVVKETKLIGNFPNPILNTTTFSFSLKERSHVKLSLYNVKGQLVDVLVNTELDPDPDHKVDWDGTANGKRLANGIYFYKLETNSKTFLKKMILMK
jgi:hypothetical protein